MSDNFEFEFQLFDDLSFAQRNFEQGDKQEIQNVSDVNKYSVDSSLCELHPISSGHNRRLINEIIDSAFDERRGTCELSSSHCSSLKFYPSEYSYDKRLEYWKNILKDRAEIAGKIREKTNKNQSDILFNRLVTVDERDKSTVKSLMDYAQRLNPTTLSTRQPMSLMEKCNDDTSTLIPELQETLPRTERRKIAQIEITGVPKEVQKEMLGKTKRPSCEKPFGWLNSRHLENRIEEKADDIGRVLEFYPDTDNLQVVGEGLLITKPHEPNSDIQITSCNDIYKISTDSHIDVDVANQTNGPTAAEEIEYGLQINDQKFPKTNYPCYRSYRTTTNFYCFPFETVVKKIFTLQNIGRKVLDFEWVYSCFYARNPNLLKCSHNEFIFDRMPFRLCSGETREIFVKFQPRRVNIVKSKWILKVKPLLFRRKVGGIIMNLSGICAVPPEYEQKLDELQRVVIDKSNKKMMETLTTGLGAIATGLIASEYTCHYQRSLSEMELFEQLNSNFKCERYNDLELLKDLYNRAKKPRDKLWDLKVETLKSSVLKVPEADVRALLFNELSGILCSMTGGSVDIEEKILDNTERHRTCFLYVRGIISTAIDEWVDLVSTLEDTFYRTTLQVINEELATPKLGDVDLKSTKNIFTLPEDESKKRQYVIEKRVRTLKPYRDAIYMQTYTLLCDFVENIVNVIESSM